NTLSVPAGKTLALVGGDVFVTGGDGDGYVIAAPGASLEIAAAAGPVDIPVKLDDFDVRSVDPAALGTVGISHYATVQMGGEVGAADQTRAGRVVIRGGQFSLTDYSQLLAKNDSPMPALGPVDIAVASDLHLGDPDLRDEFLRPIRDPSQIQSWTQGSG